MQYPESALSHLACPECGKHFQADTLHTFCTDCNAPLLAHYDVEKARKTLTRAALSARQRGIWRWSELLPVRSPSFRLTLGEGETPLLHAENLGGELGVAHLYIKNEASNPAGSDRAREMVVAVSRALELGIHSFVLASSGNDGAALAAYAARARARAHIYMPEDAPQAIRAEIQAAGAELHLVRGGLAEARQQAEADASIQGWFDLSTLREPYRIEGKKTLGQELAEAFDWVLPDVIIYPTGSGIGPISLWKAFSELEALNLTGTKRPRLVCIQAEGSAPDNQLQQRAIRESNGATLAVSDESIHEAQKELATREGILASSEGAAALAGLKQALQQGILASQESVVLFNTGSGLKYL